MNVRSFFPSDEDLINIRKEIYHSERPGFYVFKEFIPKSYVEHLVEFWENLGEYQETHKPFPGKDKIFMGCPNYYHFKKTSDNINLRNFLWNSPNDSIFHTVSYMVHIFRNVIMSKPIYDELYPLKEFAVVPRLAITKSGKDTVPMHTDWADKENFDPSKLQATLFLTKKGIDYSGTGFCFKNNQEEIIEFDEDVIVNPGDLVIWKYNNEHGVSNIETKEGQKGFIRILYPLEKIHHPINSNNVFKKVLNYAIKK